jgi:hypothetical protein
MAARKKPVKRTTVKTVRDESYSRLELYCIAMNEYYKALRVAGFPTDVCMTVMMDRSSWPDWMLPDIGMPNKMDPLEYIDDEDED